MAALFALASLASQNGVLANTPSAQSLQVAAALNTPREICLTASDPDQTSSNLTFVVLGQPAKGTWQPEYPSLYPANSRYILHVPTNAGADVITFRAFDVAAGSGVATCRVSIVSNTAPLANDMTLQPVTGTPKDITLSTSDGHTPTSLLQVTIVSGPGSGILAFK